jgi:hypothetical protein
MCDTLLVIMTRGALQLTHAGLEPVRLSWKWRACSDQQSSVQGTYQLTTCQVQLVTVTQWALQVRCLSTV